MPYKVMFFLPTLGAGGAERTITQLANAFINKDISVSLVVCDLTGKKAKLLHEVDPAINLIDLDCGRVVKSFSPLRKLIAESNYDAIISTQTHANLVCIFAKVSARSSSTLIVREVSTPSKNSKKTGAAKKALQALVKSAYRYANTIVCVSNGVQEDFKRFYNYKMDNVTTIYNPVLDDSYFEKLKAPTENAFFQPKTKVILGVGRLTEAKNFQLLIKSFSELYKQHPECRLIILGEGELREELEKLVDCLQLNDVISLPGFDPNPYAYFKYCDLFVLSSNWEGLPGVLIQALASNIKIVSTNCPSGPAEILAQSKYGILTECDNVQAMSVAMDDALYGHYVDYDKTQLNKHCKLFYKETVTEAYLQLIREK